MSYSTSTIRQFILQSFDAHELEAFWFDNFPDSYQQDFSPEMRKGRVVQLLLVYCEQRNLRPQLLTALVQARPDLYEQFFASQSESETEAIPAAQPDASAEDFSATDVYLHEQSGLEFIHIPAGDFLYGEVKETIYLPAFWLSRTAVTQTHYQRFISANPDYAVPHITAGWAEPYNWDTRQRTFPPDKAEHPVVLVNWQDAAAFCQWAELRLPTEQEWEKAGRGAGGRLYPWGDVWRDEHCNSTEIRLKHTSRVGDFSPQGDSLFGAVDMSGNVWEWTDSWWDRREKARVLRGGSWARGQKEARLYTREQNMPHYAYADIGFRVALTTLP